MARGRTIELKTKITFSPLHIRVTEKGQIETTRVALEVNRERCAEGLDSHGRPFPPGVGDKKQLDMSDTGRLLSDVLVFPSRYSFRAPHAQVVDSLYHFAGVYDEEGKAEIERRVEALLNGEVYAEEG